MVIGIDIGTARVRLCAAEANGETELLQIGEGEIAYFQKGQFMPSAIYAREDGALLLGQKALQECQMHPEHFCKEFKREFGRTVPVYLGANKYAPEDFYRAFFQYFRQCARAQRGKEPTRVCVTYPANYGENKRRRLQKTAEEAGLQDVRLLDEPTAAAYYYYKAGLFKDGATVLLYDFGGGTFDAALLRCEAGKPRLLAAACGIDRCGGADIDHLLAMDMFEAVEAKIAGFTQEMEGAGRTDREYFYSVLAEKAEKTKILLSEQEQVSVRLQAGFRSVDYTIGRETFNKKIAHLVDKTIACVQALLESAGVERTQLDAIVLTGGSSRIPLVSERLEAILQKAPFGDGQRETAVVRGAALWTRDLQ